VLGAPAPAQPVENRRTPVGSFLRRASLDELPQLLNVVRGDMSLVGPRPERTHYVRMFEGGIYRYGERHRVKSGVTGWAQVHGLRGNTSLEDRVEWDNWYIENWSPWLDFKILLRTFGAVVRAGSTVE
jgi:lipopolysaccharide/colanic/teichoic acid biosynthesis glycosyltransferase